MEYNHSIDEMIISILETRDKESFNKLLGEIKHRYKSVTPRRLKSHLDKLQNEGMITRKSEVIKYQGRKRCVEYVDDRLIGLPRYCYLTEAVRFERKLGIFEGIVSNREKRSKRDNNYNEEESQERKRKKLLLLALWVGRTGATRSRPKSEAEPGDIPIYDHKEKRLVLHELYTVPGFGVSDFLDEKNKRFLGQAGALTYVKLSKSELEQFFEKLSKLKMIKQIDEIDGEKRYVLADRKLGDFLFACWYMFFFVQDGLEAKWRYLKRPTRREYEWYRFFYGERGARLYFTELFEERKSLSKREELFRSLGLTHRDDKKRKEFLTLRGKKRMEESYDAARIQRTSIDSKYKDIISKYPSIAKPLIEKIYSPII